MSLFDKIKDFVTAEDEDDEDDYIVPEPKYTPPKHTQRGLPTATEPFPRREPIREPLWERENVIPLRGAEAIKRITTTFKIMVSEPKDFDECPELVNSLKGRKPVIINLENVEPDTARKIFDFLSGATYALNGNVQKIAQNIFVFLPENVDVQTSAESQSFKYGDEKDNPWR